MIPLDNEIFVRNVEMRCKQKGVAPTVACRDSGAGKDFLTNMKKGQSPSLGKAQQLAQYLGCTVSDLLGETGTATQVLDERYAPFIDLFADLDPAEQNKVIGDMLRRKNKKVPESGTEDHLFDSATGSGGLLTNVLRIRVEGDDAFEPTAPKKETVPSLSRKK